MSAQPTAQPTVGPKRPRARRGEGDRLRQEILDAAHALLAETGSEQAVSIRAVAQRVGVSTPSIYLHFADKQALLDAVCEKDFRLLAERMREAADGVTDPLEALRQVGLAYIRFGLDNPEQYRVMFLTRSEPGRAGDLEVGSETFQGLLGHVRACLEAGVFAGEPLQLAMTLWAAVHGVTSLMILKPHWPWPPADELAQLVVTTAGIGLVAGGRLAGLDEEVAKARLLDL